MDLATRKLNDMIHEYLDDIHGRSHIPVNQETIDGLQAIADGIQRGDLEAREELSPGQREAAQANEGVYRETTTEPEDKLSPGRRDALALSHD